MSKHKGGNIMNYFDEANKLADLVLQWWEDHKHDNVDSAFIYREEPEFVVQARRVKECE